MVEKESAILIELGIGYSWLYYTSKNRKHLSAPLKDDVKSEGLGCYRIS
jgi:hypothetical protein